jgi:hypothetical protein
VNLHLGKTIESAPLQKIKYSFSSVSIISDILFLVESNGNSAMTLYFSYLFLMLLETVISFGDLATTSYPAYFAPITRASSSGLLA